MYIKVNIKKLNEEAWLPYQEHEGDAGWDLRSRIDNDIIVLPGETVKIPTGLAMAIPNGYVGLIYARSGLATKLGLRPANCVGVIDSGYRGEIMIALHNDSNKSVTISDGYKIAQLVISSYFSPEFNVVDDLDNTERGNSGFGSTGISSNIK